MIDYDLIGVACKFYEDRGYSRVEAPWLVTKEISDITRPEGCSTYLVQKDSEESTKAFVASGEQSLLYNINKGFLPTSGRVFTVTPCIRNDPFDATHTKYFMKLELMIYSTLVSVANEVETVREDAADFFGSFGHGIEREKTREGFDLMLNGVEIGSYGHRKCLFVNWAYGTGLAEPRFSRLIKTRNW